MHPLIKYLLIKKDSIITIENLMQKIPEDVGVLREPANVIQFCFHHLADSMKNKEFTDPSDAPAILKKLFGMLVDNEKEMIDPIYISTLFYSIGEIIEHGAQNMPLVKQHEQLLLRLLQVFAASKTLNARAIASLFSGLGRTIENSANTDLGVWKSDSAKEILLDLMEQFLPQIPNTTGIAMVLFGLSRMAIPHWTEDNKSRLDALLPVYLKAFMDLENSVWSNAAKPKAQEISNIFYALGKLSKLNALIPANWQKKERQDNLCLLIRLIFKKRPEELSITHIFYGLGRLAEKGCLLPHVDHFYLMRSLMRTLPAKPDYRTSLAIITALGRMAEKKLLSESDWQENNELWDKLFIHGEFTQIDIAFFFLSVGKLAESGILTLEMWRKYDKKFLPLIEQYMINKKNIINPRGSAADASKFFIGLHKLKKLKYINEEPTNTDADADTESRDLSNSPILHSNLRDLTIHDDNDVGSSSRARVSYTNIRK